MVYMYSDMLMIELKKHACSVDLEQVMQLADWVHINVILNDIYCY